MSRNGYKSQVSNVFRECFNCDKKSCFNGLEKTMCERCLSGEKKGCFVVKKGVSNFFLKARKKVLHLFSNSEKKLFRR